MAISILFCDPQGIYSKIDGLDLWGEDRDAMQYPGPNSVVAHPPCQLWGNFASLNYKRWGGEHNRPGNDGGCFKYALNCVRFYGGVLEHPAGSKAWYAHGLTKPTGIGWFQVNAFEWVCEVWQSAYGHLARKRTWLWYCGKQPPAELNWIRNPGTHQIGRDSRLVGNKPKLSGKRASATPLSFAVELIKLAEGAS